TFTINTYRTDNDEQIDKTFTIKKEEAPAKISLKTNAKVTVATQVYSGKALKPAIKVVCQGKTLKAGTDYKVTYTNNTKIGIAKATITGIGNYTDSKTVTFKIAPKKTTIKGARSNKTKTATVTYNKAAGSVSGYQITYSQSNKFTKAKSQTTAKTSYTIKSLTKGKTYYVKVRAYKNVSGTKVYGAYSKTLKVKVK
ncbi:MAG: fibronectin type III domain-containing protein, partial [Lachnospiraceae bacterium]|nr:fibronectin type III domain-containing protein [Lachnospiraceae bacterium]